ncbi:GNAT family N-acetyltransferase [Limibacter armeniacum]|uniref:GNAT family N-acetyltransferase n=1 Tax=Limibacter armeniacum TaxID=466084 RepID=UPI002FE659DF
MEAIVETERLILREVIEDDLMGFYELDSDPEVHRYLGNNPVTDIEQSKEIIANIRKQYQEFGIGRWAVIDKETQDFVGWAGLKYEQMLRPELKYYDLGYRLKQAYWGQGIATEAALAALKYGFTELGLKEIFAAADVDHIASNKIILKVGFKFIEIFEYEGEPVNWYRLGKEEWEAISQ